MKKQNLDELIEKYKLPAKEHKKILEKLKKRIFKDNVSKENPSIMFVIGQPGSGKTTFINRTDLSKYILINSDEYRLYHKYSKEILDKYPTYYAKLTNFDVHLWGDELTFYATQSGYSILREKAPIDYSLIEGIKLLPTNYEVVVNVVVTGILNSLLATREKI